MTCKTATDSRCSQCNPGDSSFLLRAVFIGGNNTLVVTIPFLLTIYSRHFFSIDIICIMEMMTQSRFYSGNCAESKSKSVIIAVSS